MCIPVKDMVVMGGVAVCSSTFFLNKEPACRLGG